MFYVHKKTKNLYSVISECLMKLNGEWIECISYRRADIQSPMYIRQKKEFFDKFEQYKK